MIDPSERGAALKRNFRRKLNLEKLRVILGTAQGVIANPNRPGKVWVQIYSDQGLLDFRSVWAPTKYFDMTPGTPVKLKYNSDDDLEIDEPDQKALLAQGTNPVALAQRQFSPSTPQSSFETLRLVAKGGMVVGLKGWNAIANHLSHLVSYPDIDLTSYVPSAGEMCYAGIFVLADFSAVEIVTSTPRGIYDLLLGEADVNELLAAATPTSTPASAVKLIGGQTVITQDEIDNPLPGGTQDLRQTVNGPDATGSGSGTVTSIATGTGLTGGPITTSGTISLSTPVSAANGGTGLASPTANNVLLGNGSSAVQVVAPGASGNILTSNGTTWQSQRPTSGAVFTQSATVTVANTNAETTLIGAGAGSLAFATSALSSVGRQIRIDAWGYLSDLLTPSLTLKFKLGSTAILTTGAITLAAGISNVLWHFYGVATIQTAGASGKIFAQGQFVYNGLTTDIVSTAQISIDLTAALTADITATFGTASASNTISATNISVEVLN